MPNTWLSHALNVGRSRGSSITIDLMNLARLFPDRGEPQHPAWDHRLDSDLKRSSKKDVYGAFTTTSLEDWLREAGVQSVLIVGFYAHMCLSTSVREALVRGFDVVVDPNATGARDLEDEALGRQTADEVRRSPCCT